MKIKLVGVLIIVLLALSLFSFVIAKDDLPSLPGGAGEGDKEKIEDAIEKGKEIFPFDPETGEFKKTKAEERIAAIDLWMEEHASWMKVVFGMVPEISWLFAVNLWIILWLVVALILNADFALLRPFSNENLARFFGIVFFIILTAMKASVYVSKGLLWVVYWVGSFLSVAGPILIIVNIITVLVVIIFVPGGALMVLNYYKKHVQKTREKLAKLKEATNRKALDTIVKGATS